MEEFNLGGSLRRPNEFTESPSPAPINKPPIPDASEDEAVPEEAAIALPEENRDNRRKLQILIKAYCRHFKERLSGIDIPTDLAGKGEVELEEILGDIRFSMEVLSPVGFHKEIIDSGINVYELLCLSMDLKVRGLAANLQRNPDWDSLTTELALKYADVIPLGVEWRMVHCIVSTTAHLHKANTNLENSDPPSTQVASERLINAFKDL